MRAMRPVFAVIAALALTVWAAAAGAPARASGQEHVRPDVRTDTPSGLPVPRFVSLKANETYGRSGPSFRHPIHWELRRRGLPVEVIAETEHWRKVRDHLGDEMWIHRSRLDGRRHGLVAYCERDNCALRPAPRPQAAPAALVQTGVVVRLLECRETWCRVRAGAHRGWLPRRALWGVYMGETID